MVDIIVSVINDDVDGLKRTLNSIADAQGTILVMVPCDFKDIYPSEEIENYCSCSQNIVYCNTNRANHMGNFYEGLHSNKTLGDIVTFLKSGDYFLAAPHLGRIERLLQESRNTMVVCGQTQSSLGVSLYHDAKITLQGKFFKRQFIDYYTFLEDFENEIEFALNLHYISEVQNRDNMLVYLNETVVYTNSTLADIGVACQHYFDLILPVQDFFNNDLAVRYIYHLITECYFSYVEAINLELDDNTMDGIMRDIYTFFAYFRQLELTDMEELIAIYNQGILTRYGLIQHPFVKRIPCIHFIQFLELLEEGIQDVVVEE
jgi:hypothetical protein